MYSRILVPLDGSEQGERALPHAKRIAEAGEADLFLIQAVSREPEYEISRMGDFGNPTVFELGRELGRRLVEQRLLMADQYLGRVAEGLESDGLSVHVKVEQGPPSDSIVKHAKDEGIDLIVMSTRGHGGAKQLLVGSIADRVLHRSDVPVLIVPPGQV